MSNSKQVIKSNVIPFKSRAQLLASQLSLKKDVPQQTLGTTPTSEHSDPYLLTHSQGANPPTREVIYETAPSIVQSILQCVSSEYVQNRRLPAHLNRRVQLLCDHEHPAGQVLKDWLDGNQRFLRDGSETTYERGSYAEESKQ
jgi:hypothetical protein